MTIYKARPDEKKDWTEKQWQGSRNKRKGHDKERRIVNRARKEGHLAYRTAGSHTIVDYTIIDRTKRIITLGQSKPSSMSENQKKLILEALKALEGQYTLVVEVK